MQTRNVYVTRDTLNDFVEVWPDDVGIRKFHGCVQYGAAWRIKGVTSRLSSRQNSRHAPMLFEGECRAAFGFFPEPGEAWHINGKGKRTKVDIDFSDKC